MENDKREVVKGLAKDIKVSLPCLCCYKVTPCNCTAEDYNRKRLNYKRS